MDAETISYYEQYAGPCAERWDAIVGRHRRCSDNDAKTAGRLVWNWFPLSRLAPTMPWAETIPWVRRGCGWDHRFIESRRSQLE
jgi:hypothetical protein